jgi:hypothetical protein
MIKGAKMTLQENVLTNCEVSAPGMLDSPPER